MGAVCATDFICLPLLCPIGRAPFSLGFLEILPDDICAARGRSSSSESESASLSDEYDTRRFLFGGSRSNDPLNIDDAGDAGRLAGEDGTGCSVRRLVSNEEIT